MNIPILYEDNHLLIVEKPVNIPVQEDQSKDKDLLTLLKEDIKVRHKKPGNVFLALVHRLDRPVGGAMVFAKTSKAASRLSDQLRRKAIERTYLAVVHGVPSKSKDQLEDYLVKDHRKNIVRTAKPKEKEAKKAVLDYEVASEKKDFHCCPSNYKLVDLIKSVFSFRLADFRFMGTKSMDNVSINQVSKSHFGQIN